MYNKVEIKYGERKHLYYVEDGNGVFNIVAIQNYPNRDVNYWELQISKSDFENQDIESTEFKEELHNKLFLGREYELVGGSCRGSINVLKDLEDKIPGILKEVKTMQNELYMH